MNWSARLRTAFLMRMLRRTAATQRKADATIEEIRVLIPQIRAFTEELRAKGRDAEH